MSDESSNNYVISRFSKHKFMTLIFLAITIAIILTIISMVLYAWSGAAQVDLSRPGYQSVRKDAKSGERFIGFSATGEINDKVLDEFDKLYKEQSSQVLGIDAFGGNVLDDETLRINDPFVESVD